MSDTIKDTWDRIIQFWPIALFLLGLAVAIGESRVKIANLQDKVTADAEQWKLIRDQGTEITTLKSDVHYIKARTDDNALRDWTAWRATTDAKITGIEVEIRDLQRSR